MCAQAIGRRTSIPGTPCRNCGLDVGQHPNVHKCQQPRDLYLSPLPPLPPTKRLSNTKQPLQVYRKPIQSTESSVNSGSYSHLISTPSSLSSSSTSPTLSVASTASSSPISGKWSRFSPKNSKKRQSYTSGDDSNYLDNFTANLPEQDQRTRRLLGKVKVRHTPKWEQWTRQGDIQKQSGKLWGKLRMTVQNMADKIPSHDDKGPDSDESDWEGETHVTRILREYYVKKRRPLPHWLHDDQGTTIDQHHLQQRYRNETTTSNRASSPSPNMRQHPWNLNQPLVTPERRAQDRQSYPSNTSDTFNHDNASTSSQQRHLNGHEINIVQHKYTDSNYQRQQQRRSSYQINPRSPHDMDHERRFNMDNTEQRQSWGDNNDNGRPSTSLYHDRLHGPRLRSSKHSHH